MRRYCALIGATVAICITAGQLMSARAQEPTPAPPKAACDSCQPAADKLREITERHRKNLDLRDEAWRMIKPLDDAMWADTLELSQVNKELEQIYFKDPLHENATLETRRNVLVALERAIRARITGRQAAIRAARQLSTERDQQAMQSLFEMLAAEDELAKCNSGCQIVPKRVSNRWPYYSAAGLVATTLVILGGNGDTNTPGLTPIQMPAPTPTPPPVATPPAVTPPVAPPTNPTTPPIPIDFSVNVQPGFTHPGGNTSIACFAFIATAIGNAPALNQSATYSGRIQGPGVVSGGTFSGNLSAAGRALAQAVINSVGNYVANVTVLFGGVSRSATGQVNVTQNQSNCPQ